MQDGPVFAGGSNLLASNIVIHYYNHQRDIMQQITLRVAGAAKSRQG